MLELFSNHNLCSYSAAFCEINTFSFCLNLDLLFMPLQLGHKKLSHKITTDLRFFKWQCVCLCWNFLHPRLLSCRRELSLRECPTLEAAEQDAEDCDSDAEGSERREDLGWGRAPRCHFWALFTLFWVFSSSSHFNVISLSWRCCPVIGLFWLSFCHADPLAQRASCSSGSAGLNRRTRRQRDGFPCQMTWQPLHLQHKRILKTASILPLLTGNWPKSQETEIWFLGKSISRMAFSRDGMVFLR